MPKPKAPRKIIRQELLWPTPYWHTHIWDFMRSKTRVTFNEDFTNYILNEAENKPSVIKSNRGGWQSETIHPTEENYYAIDSIFVNVFDPNGLDDIRSCYLIFQKPDGSYANNGDPIYLFDDGNKSDDNISIWDRAANDGIFSRLITIGYENPLGKYYANFYVNDWSGLFTSLIDSVIVYE